jgi:hypothetical protein
VGTVKANRKGLPREGLFPKTGHGKRDKGTVKCMQKLGEDTFLTAWQDNKPVHMLSTIKPKLQNIQRKSATLGWNKAEIPSHSLIPAYNHGMGGTDKLDQLSSYSRFTHKGIRWTHLIISNFLGVSVVNATILHNMSNPQKMLSLIEFFDEVVTALTDLDKTHYWDSIEEEIEKNGNLTSVDSKDSPAEKDDSASVSSSKEAPEPKGKVFPRNRMANLEIAAERIEGSHIPILLSNKKRRRCVFHPTTKSRYLCQTCDVALCLSECAEDSCWFKFHHQTSWKDI